jgi:hypothetical protein
VFFVLEEIIEQALLLLHAFLPLLGSSSLRTGSSTLRHGCFHSRFTDLYLAKIMIGILKTENPLIFLLPKVIFLNIVFVF